jgi:CubicO group peptidase (beta-lactamase class C family)
VNPAETIRVSAPAGRARPWRAIRRPLAALAAVASAAALAAGGAAPASAAAAATPPTPPTPVTGTADLTREDLDAWLDGLVPAALDSTGVPGAAISVVHEGEVLTTRGYGYADTGADGGDPVPVDGEETLFRPGSVAKLFTATAVLQLVEDGELDLDTDVGEYLDFTVPTAFDEPLTLRHLLTHTPGFEERLDGLMLPEDAETDLRDFLATDPPEQVYAPGTVPAYSNYGYALAGYVVERVSGVGFDEYVRRNVLDPLGMDSSTFVQPLPADLAARMASGYPDDRHPSAPFEVIGGAPAGALTSSASDMAAFMLAHLGAFDGDRALLEPETLELMRTPALTEDSLGGLAGGPRMTPGFFEEHRNGHRIVGHGGDTNYFHAHLQLYPDDATGIFVALNGGGYEAIDSVQLREAVLFGFTDRYFPAEEADAAGDADGATVQPTAAEHAAMAEGTYESSRAGHTTFFNVVAALGGQTRVIAQEDGTILLTPGPETLSPLAYEEVEPWVWREVGGQRMLSMRVADGEVEAIGFGAAFTLLRADAVRDASLMLPLVIGSVAVLVLTVLSWPAGALLRLRFGHPRRDRAGRTARVLARVGVVATLAALPGWALVFARIMALAPVGEGMLAAILAAQWLGAAAAVPAAVVLVDDVRRRAGWLRCAGSALVLFGLVGVAVFAAVFQLLSFDLTY